MYRLINQNSEAVLGRLERDDTVSRYIQLKSNLQSRKGGAPANAEYQRAYRNYWSMNQARLGDQFYARYFNLLGDLKESGRADVESVARELARVGTGERQSLQFSFATKLAHMVDGHLPVYDGLVADFYFYPAASSSGKDLNEKLETLLLFYGFLRKEYARVLHDGLLSGAIESFRARFPEGHLVADEKVVDWLLWSWVNLLRGGAQQESTLLYE